MCLSAGYDLHDLLDRYSWEEIGLIAEMILRDRFGTIETLVSPLVGAVGGDYSAPSVQTSKRSRTRGNHRVHRAQDYSDDEKDNALLGALSRVGVRVRTTGNAGTPGEAG